MGESVATFSGPLSYRSYLTPRGPQISSSRTGKRSPPGLLDRIRYQVPQSSGPFAILSVGIDSVSHRNANEFQALWSIAMRAELTEEDVPFLPHDESDTEAVSSARHSRHRSLHIRSATIIVVLVVCLSNSLTFVFARRQRHYELDDLCALHTSRSWSKVNCITHLRRPAGLIEQVPLCAT